MKSCEEALKDEKGNYRMVQPRFQGFSLQGKNPGNEVEEGGAEKNLL